MDPMNNQTPTPGPVPASNPAPGLDNVSAPVPPVAPAAPASPVPPVAPAAPAPEPVAPPVAPVAEPVAPAPEPVAPVSPAAPVPESAASFFESQTQNTPGQMNGGAPVNPVFNPTGGGLVGATDPITMPAPPKAPDPVEEELKAPFKAADPVPGSIGSAISMPAGASTNSKTPSVAFNDPAVTNNQASNAAPAKKKLSKNTLILLAVIAGLVVLGLAGYLILQLTQPSN